MAGRCTERARGAARPSGPSLELAHAPEKELGARARGARRASAREPGSGEPTGSGGTCSHLIASEPADRADLALGRTSTKETERGDDQRASDEDERKLAGASSPRYSGAKPPRRNLPRRASSSAVAEVGQTSERKSTCTPSRSTSNQRLSGRRSGKGSACPVRTRRRAEAARSRDFEPGQDAIAFWSIPTTSRLATWCESCVSREGNFLRRRRG